jgi:hypothetical protein
VSGALSIDALACGLLDRHRFLRHPDTSAAKTLRDGNRASQHHWRSGHVRPVEPTGGWLCSLSLRFHRFDMRCPSTADIRPKRHAGNDMSRRSFRLPTGRDPMITLKLETCFARRALTASLLACCFLAAPLAASAANAADEIVVGAVFDLTGGLNIYGIQRAARFTSRSMQSTRVAACLANRSSWSRTIPSRNSPNTPSTPTR